MNERVKQVLDKLNDHIQNCFDCTVSVRDRKTSMCEIGHDLYVEWFNLDASVASQEARTGTIIYF